MFAYDDAVARRFPTIRAGVIHATGLANGPSPPELRDEYRAEQHATSERLKTIAIPDLPQIAAWRRVFTGMGAKPTQYRNAAEALLRRLAKHGHIPSINTLVDIGNLVSIRYAMPVAGFDRVSIAGGYTTVRFATGSELFTDLGRSEVVHPEPGEVIYVDSECVVSARRWCWRQSAQSATSTTTVCALIVVEGHHAAAEEVESALTDLTSLRISPRARPSRTYSHPSTPAPELTKGPRTQVGDKRTSLIPPEVAEQLAPITSRPRA